jgi:hypothetical protein
LVSPVSPACIEGETGKSQQNQERLTCLTCLTGKTAIAEQIAEWRAAIEGVTSELPDIMKLKEVSLRFLDGPEAGTAIENGWDAVSLFGMHTGEAPKVRIDCWGLVIFLAWGVHRCTFEAFDQKVCAIRTRAGAVLQQPRYRANFDQARPWWEHPALSQAWEVEL